jgi:hypothetical protein
MNMYMTAPPCDPTCLISFNSYTDGFGVAGYGTKWGNGGFFEPNPPGTQITT